MRPTPFSERNLNPANVKKTATSIKVPITNNIAFTAGSRLDGVGANKISKVKPWGDVISTSNRDTSYCYSYNNDHGEINRSKKVEKILMRLNPN